MAALMAVVEGTEAPPTSRTERQGTPAPQAAADATARSAKATARPHPPPSGCWLYCRSSGLAPLAQEVADAS